MATSTPPPAKQQTCALPSAPLGERACSDGGGGLSVHCRRRPLKTKWGNWRLPQCRKKLKAVRLKVIGAPEGVR